MDEVLNIIKNDRGLSLTKRLLQADISMQLIRKKN